MWYRTEKAKQTDKQQNRNILKVASSETETHFVLNDKICAVINLILSLGLEIVCRVLHYQLALRVVDGTVDARLMNVVLLLSHRNAVYRKIQIKLEIVLQEKEMSISWCLCRRSNQTLNYLFTKWIIWLQGQRNLWCILCYCKSSLGISLNRWPDHLAPANQK